MADREAMMATASLPACPGLNVRMVLFLFQCHFSASLRLAVLLIP